jgi:Uma2 family endonuclease
MVMPAAIDWTAERARALPDDGNRYEVLDGELFVTSAPTWAHQRVAQELFVLLRAYVDAHGLGAAYIAPAEIEFSPKRLVQPDVFVVPLVDGKVPRHWREVNALLLALEVLSPSTARADRFKKRHIYQDEGAGEYWIVDADARVLERWTPDDPRPEIVDAELRWTPRSDVPALVIDLPGVFARALDA